MRYLVKARLKPGREKALLQSIENGTLGQGSQAGEEYLNNMEQARLNDDGIATWVEVCYCATPLAEERPYWEKYFELISITDAQEPKNCRHDNGTELWACYDCNCTHRLEKNLKTVGVPFVPTLRS